LLPFTERFINDSVYKWSDLEAFEYKGKLFMPSICSKQHQEKWVIMMRMENAKKLFLKHQ
jgi:hypothetical protein